MSEREPIWHQGRKYYPGSYLHAHIGVDLMDRLRARSAETGLALTELAKRAVEEFLGPDPDDA